MILNFPVLDSSNLIKSAHTIISGTFLIIAVWLLARSIRGIIKNYAYTNLDKLLSYGFIITLYLQLIFGLILFANPSVADGIDSSSVEGALKMASKRFWPIEHFVLMLFALFIANLGLIFSNQSRKSRDKYRKILIYYAIAIVMIAISLTTVNLP